jgi:hypothetical protein
MSLSADLISQFTKVTKPEENTKKETTVYGSIVKYGDDFYARIDGSDTLTPISSTVDVKDGDRVSMLIKNHTAVVTGNFSKPAVNEDSQVFKGMVTFQGLSGGTTTIDGACIKTGKISADRLELTGAITWADLDEDAKDEIAANGGISASEARSIAATTITRELVESPTIRGATIEGGAFYDYPNKLMKMELSMSEDYPIFNLTDVQSNRSLFMVARNPYTLGPLISAHGAAWKSTGSYADYDDNGLAVADLEVLGRHIFKHEVGFDPRCLVRFTGADIYFTEDSLVSFYGATVTGLSVVFG